MTYFDFTNAGQWEETWIRWTPEEANRSPWLLDAVQEFEPVDVPAGWRAARWLGEKALLNHPSTVTHLAVIDEHLEAFFALCSGHAKLSQRQRRSIGPDERAHELLPIQPIARIAWLAKHRDSSLSGREILAQAAAVAVEVIEFGQGQIAVALDPVDDETERFWRERYEFKPSQTLDGRKGCLWRTLMPDPEDQDDPYA